MVAVDREVRRVPRCGGRHSRTFEDGNYPLEWGIKSGRSGLTVGVVDGRDHREADDGHSGALVERREERRDERRREQVSVCARASARYMRRRAGRTAPVKRRERVDTQTRDRASDQRQIHRSRVDPRGPVERRDGTEEDVGDHEKDPVGKEDVGEEAETRDGPAVRDGVGVLVERAVEDDSCEIRGPAHSQLRRRVKQQRTRSSMRDTRARRGSNQRGTSR